MFIQQGTFIWSNRDRAVYTTNGENVFIPPVNQVDLPVMLELEEAWEHATPEVASIATKWVNKALSKTSYKAKLACYDGMFQIEVFDDNTMLTRANAATIAFYVIRYHNSANWLVGLLESMNLRGLAS